LYRLKKAGSLWAQKGSMAMERPRWPSDSGSNIEDLPGPYDYGYTSPLIVITKAPAIRVDVQFLP
jgi:hypothetical protein